jgi:hypothetical protein
MTVTQPAPIKLGAKKKAINPKLLIVLGVVFVGSILFKFGGGMLSATSAPKLAPIHSQPFHHLTKSKGSAAPAAVVATNRDPFAAPPGYSNR